MFLADKHRTQMGVKDMKRWKIRGIAVLLLFMLAVSGCGNAAESGQAAESGDSAADEKTGKKPEKKENPKDSAGKSAELKYLELTEIEDSYGDRSTYKVYAPRENSVEDGFLFYSSHGLTFAASVFGSDMSDYMVETLESSVKFVTDELEEDPECTEYEAGEVLENGEDVYQIVKAKKKDVIGLSYEVNHIYYMDIQEDGAGVLWDLELRETGTDEETDLIIDELAQCYNIDLDSIRASGEWAVANEEYYENRENFEKMKEERDKEHSGGEKKERTLPETVLWFNATYAPLTYSNNCDWEIVGGMEPSEFNGELDRYMLERDWGIEDADSAIETIEDLKENGHRAKCRECMEELKRLGILGEKDEEKLLRKLQGAGIKENLYRYVLANQMYQSGLDADYIAAWDLCRVNQLYADFYICGYMTYEETMDASLENSLKLQQMYSSWEDMAVAYLVGYQFWRSDPMTAEDSPTAERYQCYLDLLEMEDGPYTLDWDMKLEKSW